MFLASLACVVSEINGLTVSHVVTHVDSFPSADLVDYQRTRLAIARKRRTPESRASVQQSYTKSASRCKREYPTRYDSIPKDELLALQKCVDAADGDLHIHLGLLDLNQKSTNQVASHRSNKW